MHPIASSCSGWSHNWNKVVPLGSRRVVLDFLVCSVLEGNGNLFPTALEGFRRPPLRMYQHSMDYHLYRNTRADPRQGLPQNPKARIRIGLAVCIHGLILCHVQVLADGS